tara:strand:+ start:473 stop:640 length:168 start_codon:yes stop_codon:yes gene_type:complete
LPKICEINAAQYLAKSLPEYLKAHFYWADRKKVKHLSNNSLHIGAGIDMHQSRAP